MRKEQVDVTSLNAKHYCYIFQHIIWVSSNICPICQQASECPMQRAMLAAVQATDERLIAPGYLMQISAHLAFSYTKCVLLVL